MIIDWSDCAPKQISQKKTCQRTVFRDPGRCGTGKIGCFLSCREYTLPRDEQPSKVKGWIRGNTMIDPVLEVAVSYHQGRWAIEIRIKSSLGDGSPSWIMIVNGLNRYVTEMPEETQESRNDEIGGNPDAIFCESYDTISHAKMDRRRTRRVRLKLYWSFEEDYQIVSTWSCSTSRGRRSSRIQNLVIDVSFKKFTSSPNWSIRTSLNYLQKGWGPRKRFQYCLEPYSAETIFKTFEHVKATLEENKLIQHCRATCCYRATSPSTATTLEAPTTCTLSPNQDWFRVEKILRKGDRRLFFTVVSPMSIHLHKQRNNDVTKPRIAVNKKIGKYTRTQFAGLIWGLLRRRDWRSIEQDQTRSSFTTLHQRCVLRRWWSWIQEKHFSTKCFNLLVLAR